MSLMDDLMKAEASAVKAKGSGCGLCDVIAATEDEGTREALRTAAAGTIGTRRFSEILRAHGADVSRPHIQRHRDERHES